MRYLLDADNGRIVRRLEYLRNNLIELYLRFIILVSTVVEDSVLFDLRYRPVVI